MIIWGGLPSANRHWSVVTTLLSDTWTPVGLGGAPDYRYLHTAVWTGTDMIVWGGAGGARPTT